MYLDLQRKRLGDLQHGGHGHMVLRPAPRTPEPPPTPRPLDGSSGVRFIPQLAFPIAPVEPSPRRHWSPSDFTLLPSIVRNRSVSPTHRGDDNPLPDAPTNYSFYYANADEDTANVQWHDTHVEVERRRTARQSRDHLLGAFRNCSPNLVNVNKAFLAFTNDDGLLSFDGYTAAHKSLGVRDFALVESSFNILEPKRAKLVDYKKFISLLDAILNGTQHKENTLKACFDLFDPTQCGYIIGEQLRILKAKGIETEGRNHLMVKELLTTINVLQAEVDEQRKRDWLRRRRRRRRRADKNDVDPPPLAARKMHLNLEEFTARMEKSPLLVQAFLPKLLLLMEKAVQQKKSKT